MALDIGCTVHGMTTDNHNDNRPRPLAHCPHDCSCRGTMDRPRTARAMETARDTMSADEYNQAIARALALATS